MNRSKDRKERSVRKAGCVQREHQQGKVIGYRTTKGKTRERREIKGQRNLSPLFHQHQETGDSLRILREEEEGRRREKRQGILITHILSIETDAEQGK